jgi:DNA-binding transcriptional LysR family regulator
MTAHLDSELLRTLAAIADSGSFTRAATVVGRTQSAVSMQVKRLEEAAGGALFTRQARGVVLTPAGERLLTTARRVLRLLDEAAAALTPDALAGAVQVGIPEEYGSSVLPTALARFAERHAGVEVTVTCASSLELERALARGALDLAVLVVDSGAVVRGEVLLRDPTVWVTSDRHVVHEQDPLPVAMFEPGCWWRDHALQALDDRGRRYRVAYTSASVAGLRAAVVAGLAVSVLGQSMMPPLARRLGAADGFADLPGSSVVLRRRRGAAASAAGMAAAIAEAFAAMAPGPPIHPLV